MPGVAAAGAALPDGRAYEQVTPVDKNGSNAQSSINLVEAAASGGAVTFLSNAGVPGGEGAQNTPLFLSARGAGAWSTIGLQPPATTGPNGGPIRGWDEDLRFSFSSNNVIGGPRVLYMREGATANVTPIVTGVSNPSYAGASADAGEFLFEDQAALAPGAIAGKSNVYLWDRADGALRLASVKNDGQAPEGGAVAGPYAWFSGTPGASVGGSAEHYYTGPEHAISADGTKVWFTDAEGQLYLRENPTAPQSPVNQAGECTVTSDACTVRASATQKTNGRGEGGVDLAGPRKAAFMDATPSGEDVFFTSPEKLTNDATTGPEPFLPAIARSGSEGEGVELGFIPTGAKGIAVDGSHIYWAEPQDDAIGRADIGGSQVEEHFITGADSPQAVAVDSGHVYWVNAGDGTDGGGSIGRATLGGGAVEQRFIPGVVGGEDVVNGPTAIAVDAEHIYWANVGPEGSPDPGTKIMRAPLNGSAVEMFGKGSEGEPLAWPATGLTIANGYLYLAYFSYNPAVEQRGSGCIFRIETAEPINFKGFAGSCDNELTGFPRPEGAYGGIAVSGSHVYWTFPGRDAIARSGLEGEDVELEYLAGASNPNGLASDPAHLYWSTSPEGVENEGNDLYRYESSTGRLTDLTVDPSDKNGAEVQGVLGASDDGSRIYFAANGVLAGGASSGDCEPVGTSFTGHCNLYLREGFVTRFIARLDATGLPTESDAADWYPTTDLTPFSIQRTARVSGDGVVLLFRSRQKLTGYENEGLPEFYRYDATSGETVCVSCDPSGAAPRGAASLRTDTSNMGISTVASSLTRNMSADGNRIFFESPDALVPGDTNEAVDVYEWESDGTGTCASEAQDGGCLYLISSGTSPQASRFADAGSSGDDVFFFTTQPLVAQDTDELVDIYDARVGGGIPSQDETPPRPCAGEGCRGAGSSTPGLTPPGSSSFTGPGNQKPARPCGKGKVRRHDRCVKKTTRKRRHHHGKRHGHKSGKRHDKGHRHGSARRAS